MRQHRWGAAAVCAAAALLLVPPVASAQVSVGVGRFGVSVGTPYYGYYSPGYYTSGYYPSYYSYGYYPYRSGYTAPAYAYGTYSPYSTWYGSTWSYPSYATTDYYYTAPVTSSGTTYPSGTGSYYTYGAPSRQEERDAARLNVRLPDPEADVWVEGKRTQQRGLWREFISPPLTAEKSYTYEVRARWTENGKEREATKTVAVRPNGVATVDFTVPTTGPQVEPLDQKPRTDIDRERRGTTPPPPAPGTTTPRTTNPKTDNTRPPDRP
jgi:uncharacterized protein (TIGR03000 family)